jgi:hypothetical protein
MKTVCAFLVLWFFGGCSSVYINPKSIAAVHERDPERNRAQVRLREAVAIANDFLVSDVRKTLPSGSLRLGDDGIVFSTAKDELAFRIKCSFSGDILIPFGMAAQERSWGFVVGTVPPRESRVLDNSLFKVPSGRILENCEIAGIILHELTHTYFRAGTVSFGKALQYYGESIFLLRYRSHTMERLPFRTSSEFEAFVVDHMKRQNSNQPNQQ